MVPQFHSRLAITPYGPDRWYLTEPLIYATIVLGFPWRIHVPATDLDGGFSTDLATIPHILRPIIRRDGTHQAAVVHDWLCSRNGHHNNKGRDGIDRGIADKIFREALVVSGVNPIKAQIMYLGVRAYSFGRR